MSLDDVNSLYNFFQFPRHYEFVIFIYRFKIFILYIWLVPKATNLWFCRVSHAGVLAQGQRFGGVFSFVIYITCHITTAEDSQGNNKRQGVAKKFSNRISQFWTEQEGRFNNLINKYIILVSSCCLIGVFASAKNEDFAFSDERSSASIASQLISKTFRYTIIVLLQKLKRLGKVFQ